MASWDALEDRVLLRDAPLARDAALLLEPALRLRAALLAGVPVPFAALPVVLSLSAMGFLLLPVATAGKLHGSRSACARSDAGSKPRMGRRKPFGPLRDRQVDALQPTCRNSCR
ncbi:hypothetical protein EN868_28020 [Mesorhizobium sp. M2D.F.Ca.ET.225.01.1.1]|uniref:hypothetical protein n=1 Tax=Mesorhizobium sp. M2D.F.Ca.ET.206.01.1.1 TaxID=2563939 RepID=UPI00109283FB|nr:hypothetical protein [Mesorhizobium sp. M2D.F.Ca.ET.206.01.1.1]TGP62574.1 hypothetical protein EN868_28020 [Mesorhizobium sp. M2D.F.Ca.ET.225.01.1.1]TGQ82824.1 hypothetical protein EN849_27815 [Mesorhizobium sp. M2D.F.Ca.ET.206.01.1.1]